MPGSDLETQKALESGEEFDLGLIIRWIWDRRTLYLIIGFICCLLAVGYSYIVPQQYTGKVILLPKIPVQKAGLLGPLAALTGETAALGGVDEELYGVVLNSDFILNRVISKKWPTGTGGEDATLFEIFGLSAEKVDKSEDHRAYLLKSRLRVQVIRFDRDPITGIMSISTTVPENAALAAALANFLADELDEYNGILDSKQNLKHKEFVESRLKEIEEELKASEERLTRFLEENKSYQSSPKLLQKHGEMERDVYAFRSIWLKMRTQLESAKIEVNKDIDSINILDRATPPLFRSSPKRRVYLLVGGILGFFLASAIALLRLKTVFSWIIKKNG